MFVLTRRSALPVLSLVPGAVARCQAERVTLWPVSTTQETVLTVESLPEGGYGVLANAAGHTTRLAHYPSRRQARHQLRRLAGVSSGRWRRPLGYAALAALLLFLAWFLFFVPSGPLPDRAPSVDPTGRPPVGTTDPAPTSVPPTAPPDDAPAFVDDPLERLREVPAAPPPESPSKPPSP
ncbi:MAG: hypothetical protein V9G18_12820 [Albidovulum sp.]